MWSEQKDMLFVRAIHSKLYFSFNSVVILRRPKDQKAQLQREVISPRSQGSQWYGWNLSLSPPGFEISALSCKPYYFIPKKKKKFKNRLVNCFNTVL